MSRGTFVRMAVALAMALSLATLAVFPTQAQAPNDLFGDATVIITLPYDDTVDMTLATTSYDDPYPSCFWGSLANSVWYKFMPDADKTLKVDTVYSDFPAVIGVYTYSDYYGLSQVDCTTTGPMEFEVQAGTQYYFFIATEFPYGLVGFHLEEIVLMPPINDNFVDAVIVSGIPFSYSGEDTHGATTEMGEPAPTCSWMGVYHTVWFAYTPATNSSVVVRLPYAPFYDNFAAIYTGSELASLAEQSCTTYLQWNQLSFSAEAGTTYYIQLGSLYEGGFGTYTLEMDYPPPPVAGFYYEPYQPSTFDTITFWDSSYDPICCYSFSNFWWDFGDGATANGYSVNHKYAADGDYTVWHKVETSDGRTAETTQTLQVRTHDVAITKLIVPQTARVGQTRQIVVGVRNSRYPEVVRVELYKSTIYGFDLVGTLQQTVPVRPANRTTDFNFSYTFSNDDGALGKLTFKAVAYLQDARDALPADNEAIALPTKVTGYVPPPYEASIASPASSAEAVSTFGVLGLGLAFGVFLVGAPPKKWRQ
jgi:hypothetical protein